MHPAAELNDMLNCATSFASTLDRFLDYVRDTPQGAAILFEDRQLNYRELDELANRIATALHLHGVEFGESVGLCIHRSPEAIAAMLGAFKLGAVFVPLDPEYPLERVRYMIDDAAIRVIISMDVANNALAQLLIEDSKLHWIDCASSTFQALEVEPFHTPLQAADLAYIMYTSGSTGNPKGVQIEHLSLTTYCEADIEVYQLTSADRTLQFSTLNFDACIEEIFPPLLSGGCVVVRPRERAAEANELSMIVRDYDVTALHLATAYWHEWVDLMKATSDRVPPSLRMVLATGEKVSVEHYRRWLSLCDHDILWCNAYGPTETTVTATVFIPDDNFCCENMPIGKPLPGYRAHILDEENRELGVAETGLLYISGPALARGYLNRPELTEKAFRVIDLDGEGPTRLYRTGDLARWLPDGNIEFAGRIDHQIKLGSYRIEPGEIEAVLCKYALVKDSIVIYEQIDGQKHLIAYVACDLQPTIEDLVDYLRTQLPVYMIPARFVLMDSLPKTINGKIDRAALPSPATSLTISSHRYVPPRDEMEARLCQLWQQVLNVPQVGIHDDFFALGGSSLLVTRVVAELMRTYGIQLPVRDFFANPTAATAARHLRKLTGQALTHESTSEDEDQRALRSRLPRIRSEFLSSDTGQLFSVFYAPPVGIPNRSHGVMICQPYGHEYMRAYRNLQQLAVQLAAEGFHVMRFDYHGTGNSSGDQYDCRVDQFRDDARCAARALRSASRCDKLTLIGLRLGATLIAKPMLGEVENLVLWDPIASGTTMLDTLRDLHRHALTSQTRFARLIHSESPELFGHACTPEMIVGFNALQLPESCSKRHLVITTRGYLDNERSLKQRLQGWNTRAVDDDIHWHRPEFTESAFASPESCRMIIEFIKGGEA